MSLQNNPLEPNNPDPEHKMAKNPLYNDESFLARCEQLRLGVELREEEHGDVSTENHCSRHSPLKVSPASTVTSV